MNFNKNQGQTEQENPEVAQLKAQVTALQTQLETQLSERESSRLEKEANEMKKETAVLEQEANVKKVLSDAFSPAKTGMASDEELEQSELINIFGDALGEAQKAQEDLILTKVAGVIKNQDAKLEAVRKTILELVTGLSVKNARDKYSDFDTIQGDVQKIMSTTALDAGDAYLLVKARKAQNQPGAQPETERPSRAPSAPASRDSYVTETPEQGGHQIPVSPRAAFRSAAAAAIDRVIAARHRQ
jgi:hypothetical protein